MGLVATVYMGPRKGVFSPSGKYLPLRSSPLNAAFGGLILWWCWFAFNAGSTLGVSGGVDVLAAIVSWNTAIGAGAAVAAALSLSFYRSNGRFVDIFDVVTGLLAGLVGITSGAAVVTSWAALIIGAVAGVAAIFIGEWLATLGIDDPVGAVPVHVGAAVVGMLLTGLFALPVSEGRGNTLAGEFYGGDGTLIGVQLLAVIVIMALGLVAGLGQVLLVDKIVGGLRVSSLHEEQGLDKSEHNLVQIRVSNHMDGLDMSDSDQSGDSDGDQSDGGSPGLAELGDATFTKEGKRVVTLADLSALPTGGGNSLFDEGEAPNFGGGRANLLAPAGGAEGKARPTPALLKELMGTSQDLAGFLLDDNSSMMGTMSDRGTLTGRSGMSDSHLGSSDTLGRQLARIFARDGSHSVRSLASIQETSPKAPGHVHSVTSDTPSSGRPPRSGPPSPSHRPVVPGEGTSSTNRAVRTAYGNGGIYYGSKRTSGGGSNRRANAAKLLSSMQKRTHKKTVKEMKSSQAKLAKQLLRLTAEMILERTQDDIAWVPMHQLDAFQQNYSAVSAADGAHSSLTVEQMHPSVKKLQDHARRKSAAASNARKSSAANSKASAAAVANAAAAGAAAGVGSPTTDSTAAAATAGGGSMDEDGPTPRPQIASSSLSSPEAMLPTSSLQMGGVGASVKGGAGEQASGGVVDKVAKGGGPAGASVNPIGVSHALLEELELDDTESM